ncbi:MAG: efflux RND transporter periplasmic adaptor subunit [Acidobacteriota bacterium]|nr:efflux RND transporter periplasmic adaptor subunit [Acidobacteriota bacterium]
MERESHVPWKSSGEDPLDVLWAAHASSATREKTDRPSPRTPSEGEEAQGERGKQKKRFGSRRFWGAGVLLLALLVGGIAYQYREEWRRTPLGIWLARDEITPRSTAEAIYYCPMHPEYKSERLGECPVCGMTLVPLESASKDASQERVRETAEETLPPGTVHISPLKQQLIGVTYGEVMFGPIVHTIRTVGKITYDETKIARVHPKIEGWIERVHADYVGKFVQKGQPLVEVYSPELVATQQEYLLALRAKETLGRSAYREIAAAADSLYEASKRRLELWDIPEADIQRIRQRGQPLRALTLYAPVSGFILARNAFERQRATPETELYVIADLSTVWVLADIYESEVSMIRVGQAATMTTSAFPGKVFRGRISYISPQVDNVTRTVKVRLEFPNPGFVLKPDMYANVEIHVNYGRHLWVPESAVLDSGDEQILFVAHEGGYFEPRRVRVGPRVGDRYVILEGVRAGERIVTSGTFLIDSESRLKSALQGLGHAGHGRAPATSTKPSPEPSGHKP